MKIYVFWYARLCVHCYEIVVIMPRSAVYTYITHSSAISECNIKIFSTYLRSKKQQVKLMKRYLEILQFCLLTLSKLLIFVENIQSFICFTFIRLYVLCVLFHVIPLTTWSHFWLKFHRIGTIGFYRYITSTRTVASNIWVLHNRSMTDESDNFKFSYASNVVQLKLRCLKASSTPLAVVWHAHDQYKLLTYCCLSLERDRKRWKSSQIRRSFSLDEYRIKFVFLRHFSKILVKYIEEVKNLRNVRLHVHISYINYEDQRQHRVANTKVWMI